MADGAADDTVSSDVEVIRDNLKTILERLDSTWEYARIAFGDAHQVTRDVLHTRNAAIIALAGLGGVDHD